MKKGLVSRLILPSLLIVCLSMVYSQQVSHAQSLRPFVIPRVGDFITYNNSATEPDGNINYTDVVWNLTFAANPSQDVFGVSFQSFYNAPQYPPSSNPPANGSYWLVDVANMIITSTTGFPYITPSDLPMAFPFLLPTNASLGSNIQVASQNPLSYNLVVVDEQNITLDGATYQCWNASGQSTSTEMTNVLFEKSSGIVLYLNKHSSLNFESNVFQLEVARVGDYSFVNEFLPIMLLPLLIGVSIVAVLFRRKRNTSTINEA